MTPAETAEAYAHCTGSSKVTSRVERRNEDGTLTVEAEGTYTN